MRGNGWDECNGLKGEWPRDFVGGGSQSELLAWWNWARVVESLLGGNRGASFRWSRECVAFGCGSADGGSAWRRHGYDDSADAGGTGCAGAVYGVGWASTSGV